MNKAVFLLFLFLFVLTPAGWTQTKSDLSLGYETLDENPSQALAYFEQAKTSIDADLSEYRIFGSAKARYLLKDFISASQDFSQLTEERPESVLAEHSHLHLVRCAVSLDRFDEALAKAKNYFKKYPEGKHSAEITFLKGAALKGEGRFREAYKAYNEADLWYPLSSYAKKSRAEMKKLARKHKFAAYHPNPKRLFERGENYFDAGDYESAAALFARLAREYPRHKLTAKAFLMLGRAEMESGSDGPSIKNIEQSVRLTSGTNQGRGLYFLGRAHGRRGRYARAIKAMNAVIRQYPQSNYADDALYYLGIYYEKTDSPEAALSSYLNLIAEYPSGNFIDDAVLRAGYLYYVKHDLENSFKIYSLAKNLPVMNETPQCLFLWGLVAEKMGRADHAAGIYYYLADKFDHTYQSYRAKEKLDKLGYITPSEKLSGGGALTSSEINEANVDEAVENWKDKNPDLLNSVGVSDRLRRYEKLMEIGLSDFAYLEAKELLLRTEGPAKESAQLMLARVMQKSGEYSAPIRYVENRIKSAVLRGRGHLIPKEAWQLAYPKGYWGQVEEASKKHGLDPYLALAVIREESRFNPRALSRSRAHGLMQIIPSTGKILAKQLDIKPYRRSKMYNVETNVEMGTYYLANLIKRFNGNVALALAGYNGGPVRVRKWMNSWYNGDVDEFIQGIPIRETRYYVQKVLGSYYEYKRIYGGRS